MSEEKIYIERLFVYCGLRYNQELDVLIQPLDDSGALLAPQLYSYKRGRDKVLGGIYKGASFYEGGVRGLDDAVYVDTFDNRDELISWQAKHEEAKLKDRALKLEANAKKISEINRILAPLRKVHSSFISRRDYAGAEALEASVLRALRMPLNKTDNE